MKMYLISDNVDTLTGMRLAGVDGVVVHELEIACSIYDRISPQRTAQEEADLLGSREELRRALETTLADKEIGIILLTEKFGREFPEIIDDVKLNHRIPLIIEIPDRHGTGRKADFITSYVNEAIGLKL